MQKKRILALIMGAITASSGISQMTVQVYADDEESSSISDSYKESSNVSDSVEEVLDAEPLTKLLSFGGRTLNGFVSDGMITAELENLYVSESKLVFEPMPNNEAKLVCCDLKKTFDGVVNVPQNVVIEGKTYTVTSIGDSAFKDYIFLKNVTLPVGITEIGRYAFQFCASLQSVELPSGVTKIGKGAFVNCIDLQLTALPEDLIEIGENAFKRCSNLRLKELPVDLIEIGERAFANTTIERITIPASVIRLGHGAFDTYSMEEINLLAGTRLTLDDIKRACGECFDGVIINGAYAIQGEAELPV